MYQRSHKKRNFVTTVVRYPVIEVIARPAQSLSSLIKAGVIDGFSTSTGLYDDVDGEVSPVFDPSLSRLELADHLLREGASVSRASTLAEKGISQ